LFSACVPPVPAACAGAVVQRCLTKRSRERRKGEVQLWRTPLLRGWVNKGERMRCGENTGREEGSVPIMGTTQCRQAGGGR
jgi:hypothetical protein